MVSVRLKKRKLDDEIKESCRELFFLSLPRLWFFVYSGGSGCESQGVGVPNWEERGTKDVLDGTRLHVGSQMREVCGCQDPGEERGGAGPRQPWGPRSRELGEVERKKPTPSPGLILPSGERGTAGASLSVHR